MQLRQVARVGVHVDFDAIGRVGARAVEQDMAAGDDEETAVALEEEPAGRGQAPGACECQHPRDAEACFVLGAIVGFAYGWFASHLSPIALLRGGFVIQGLGLAPRAILTARPQFTQRPRFGGHAGQEY